MKKILFIILTACLSFSAFAANKEVKDTAAFEPFTRNIGISTSTFIPKGTVGFGAAISYNTYDLGNAVNDAGYKMLFGLLTGIQGEVLTVGVAPYVSYFVMDNLSVGARFEYSKTSFGLQNLGIDVMDLGLGINDFYYNKNSYLGSVAARYYIPFGNSRRFAMFAELRGTGGYAQSETFNYSQGEDASGISTDKLGTYQDIYKFNIGVIPGITAFFTNNIALEMSVGLIGLDYQKVVQNTNQVDFSVAESSSANFKVNLLAVNLGLSFYIPTGQHSKKAQKAYAAKSVSASAVSTQAVEAEKLATSAMASTKTEKTAKVEKTAKAEKAPKVEKVKEEKVKEEKAPKAEKVKKEKVEKVKEPKPEKVKEEKAPKAEKVKKVKEEKAPKAEKVKKEKAPKAEKVKEPKVKEPKVKKEKAPKAE